MSLLLYMDVHVPRAISRTLIAAGVDIITAQEDHCARLSDPELLDRAAALGRILFTRDDDLLVEATRRQRMALPFSGVIFAHQMRANIGQCVHDLHLLTECLSSNEVANQVIHLPLR